jgi:hypothetical protein
METVALPAYGNPGISFTVVGKGITIEVRSDLSLRLYFTGDAWCGACACYTTHQLS